MVLLALVTFGAVFYTIQKQTMQKAAENQLASIARLKIDQISAWRNERLEKGLEVATRPFLSMHLIRFLAEPQAQDRQMLLAEFSALKAHDGYMNIMLVDQKGLIKLSLPGPLEISDPYAKAIGDAFHNLKPAISALHADNQNPDPHITVVVPLFPKGIEGEPIGALVLVTDAARFLFPLIQSWPVASRSAETLLVRRDGDDVLFLSPLRHKANTALELRIPLSQTDLPAAMAIKGYQGIAVGNDYRGVRVASFLQPIPDSPWFMVTKEDAAELYADWRLSALLMVALLLSTIALASMFVLVVRQHDQKKHFQSLYKSEAALRIATERYGVTLKAIGDAVISTDAQGKVELLNAAAEALTGWDEATARGRSLQEVFQIIDELTRRQVENPATRVLREGVVVGLANHTLLIDKNGVERPIADSGAPIRNEKGEITGVVLVFRDQSEERAYQKQIRESEKRYKALYNSIRDAILVTDINRTIVDCNPAFAELFEYSPENIIGKKSSIVYENEVETEAIGKVLSEGGNNDTHHFFLTNLKKKSGELFPAEAAVYLLRDDEGKAIGHIGLIRDVTRRKQTEAERTRLLRAIEQTTEMIVITDAQGTIQYVNPAFESVTGYTRQEAVGKNPRLLKSGAHDEHFYRNLWKTISGGNTWEGRIVNKRKDGKHYTEETIISPVGDGSGRIVNFVAAKRDISKQLILSAQLQQAQKLESIGRLAGGVAHDYNNMLSVIMGYAELAIGKIDESHPIHEDLAEILKAADRSMQITRQLLAFARRQTIAPKLLDLNETVEAALKMLRHLIGEDVDLKWLPKHGLWPVKMDLAQIEQILANLCVNARDAIEGVGRITIETENVSFDDEYCTMHEGFNAGDYVQLTVSDSGCGIEKEVLDHIFEPFFTTKREGQGTGLGLSTVYGIVKQNNGFINVYSEPDKGTTIKIYLARYLGPIDSAKKEKLVPMPTGRGETILLVEDERSILELARKIIHELGYHVLVARTPGEAIRLAEQRTGDIALLITDVVMPEMNGKDLYTRLSALRPNLKSLFMSGYTANVIAHHGVLDDGVHFIQKPFSRKDLAQKIRSALN